MDMKIAGAYSQYVSPPIKINQLQHQNNINVKRGTDRLSLSPHAEDYKTAMRAMSQTPDVRHDLVNNISEMIATGRYNISAHDVAAKIFHGLGN